jgi:hypothetical protein
VNVAGQRCSTQSAARGLEDGFNVEVSRYNIQETQDHESEYKCAFLTLVPICKWHSFYVYAYINIVILQRGLCNTATSLCAIRSRPANPAVLCTRRLVL